MWAVLWVVLQGFLAAGFLVAGFLAAGFLAAGAASALAGTPFERVPYELTTSERRRACSARLAGPLGVMVALLSM
jgi:hypothetical protein